MVSFGGCIANVYCSRCYSVVVETPPCDEGSILYQQYKKYCSIFDDLCQGKSEKMIYVNFDTLLRAEALVEKISASLGNYTRFWTDFVTPLTFGGIDDIFETGGRGLWADLDPLYAARKAVSHPGKGILRRGDVYFAAATSLNHPGNLAEFGPTEMVLGIDGAYFESTFGANYPAIHEEGNLSARPVYELIVAGERFEERIGQLGEKYLQEEIAAAARSL